MPILAEAVPLSVLSQLKAEWPSPSWSWDGRLPTVTSSIVTAQIEKARAIALTVLPQQFDATTIAQAPAEVIAVVDRSGGLRGNQLVFCGNESEPRAFGLWWPWGGGGNVSLRIGLIGADRDQALSARLRELFDVQG